jgi:hypothetical protein
MKFNEKNLFEISLAIPILFGFLYICYRKQLVLFMNSILGKLIVCFLIIYYTLIDKIYGLFVCSLFILFYQMDSTIWLKEGFYEFDSLCSCSKTPSTTTPTVITNNKIQIENELQEDKKTAFQKKHCSLNGQLMYKNLPVKKTMASFVFPEIKYGNEYNICNLCDKNCDYNIEEPAVLLRSSIHNI